MDKIISRFMLKTKNALIGFGHVLREEGSIWMQLFLALFFVGIGIWLKLEFVEWAVFIFIVAVNIGVEVINTSIEAAVDTIMFQYNVKVKKIKDIAAGATLVMTLGTTIAFCLIFIPKIMEVF